MMTQHWSPRLLSLTIALWLMAGCATHRTPFGSPQPTLSFAARQSQLRALSNWQAQGSMLVRYRQKATLIYFDWKEQKPRYYIRMKGLLGIGGFSITGQPGFVQLKEGDTNPPISATSPEALLSSQLGWSVPITPLHFWMLGIPSPGHAFKAQLDQSHHLITLKQEGWLIHFSHYTRVSYAIDLPQRLTLERLPSAIANRKPGATQKISAKIHISRWKLFDANR